MSGFWWGVIVVVALWIFFSIRSKAKAERERAFSAMNEAGQWFDSQGILRSSVKSFDSYNDPDLVRNPRATVIVGIAKTAQGHEIGFALEVVPGQGVVAHALLVPAGIATWHRMASMEARAAGLALIDVLSLKAEAHRARHNGGREAPVVGRPVGNRNTQAVSPPVPTSQPGSVPLSGGGSAGWAIGGVVIAIGVLIVIGNSGNKDSQPNANLMPTRPPVASSTPAPTSTPALTPPSIEQKQAKKKVDPNKDMRHCLNLPTNEAIAKCANRRH